jgi:hypothetical protein
VQRHEFDGRGQHVVSGSLDLVQVVDPLEVRFLSDVSDDDQYTPVGDATPRNEA